MTGLRHEGFSVTDDHGNVPARDALAPRAGVHRTRSWRFEHVLALMSVVGLLWMLSARVLAPSEAWDQDQPKTMGYTTDMLVNGRWVLPQEQGRIKASKPPLYNWIAAPAVKLIGYSSETAHKFPSWAALIASWALLVYLGVRIDRAGAVAPAGEHATLASSPSAVGWLAGLMMISTYTIFKIGYTARPDMILCLFLFLGWMLATVLIIRAEGVQAFKGANNQRAPQSAYLLVLGFWLCFGLAALAKGPPALLLVLYALLACRFIGGSWRSARIFGWWWGLPLGVGMFAIWIWGVYRIDPEHLVQRLWFDEFVGRVTGLGEQGNTDGPIEFVRRLFHAPFYFLVRFIPWSILAILAVIHLWERDPDTGRARWRSLTSLQGRWLHGAALWVVLVVVFFSLSTGIRADYVAPAYLPASLLAAWWILRAAPHIVTRIFWAAPAVAAVILIAMTSYQFIQPQARADGFGESIMQLIRTTERQIAADPAPLEFWNAGRKHVQAYLRVARPEDHDALRERLARGEAMWIIAGINRKQPQEFPDWIAAESLDELVQIELIFETIEAPRSAAWPGRMSLYRASPKPARAHADS